LLAFPDRAQGAGTRRRDTRELIAYSYRIIYTVKQDQVTIAAVIHGKRML
jgi:plasmid stabilization system protein ParE